MTQAIPEDCALLVIHGLTEDGQPFRPSDWIERLLDTVSVYGADRRTGRTGYAGPERRREQIAFLQARVIDGGKCLVIDMRLRLANPPAFNYLLEFVRSHRLRCIPVPGP